MVPVQVLDPTGLAGLTGVTALSVGLTHACTLGATGAVMCWGDNGEGELGDGGVSPDSCGSGYPCSTVPVHVDIFTGNPPAPTPTSTCPPTDTPGGTPVSSPPDWLPVPSAPGINDGGAAATGTDGRVYFIGSLFPSDTTYAYDPVGATWTTVAPLLDPRYFSAATTGADGRIYDVGGLGSGATFATLAEVYTPGANTWTFIPGPPTPRYGPAAVTGPDGTIYVIGGSDSSWNGQPRRRPIRPSAARGPSLPRCRLGSLTWLPRPGRTATSTSSADGRAISKSRRPLRSSCPGATRGRHWRRPCLRSAVPPPRSQAPTAESTSWAARTRAGRRCPAWMP